jgi:xylulokinase
LLDQAAAIAIAGQQHGMIVLDADDQVIRPALLWNDLRSAPQAAALVGEFGGPRWWAEQTGSVPGASFTASEAALAGRARAGQRPPGLAGHAPARLADVAARRQRASDRPRRRVGHRLLRAASGHWLPEFVGAALGHHADLPRVAGPAEVVGETSGGAVLAAGTGDNMAAALGLGLGHGEVVVSIGTSGTVFAISDEPAADPSGAVAGFADATGRFLPLVCTANAGLVLGAAATMTGTDLTGLSERALAAQPRAGGITLLPYLDGERTPDRPAATGVITGLTTSNATPDNLARAAVEGVLCSLADAADLLAGYGVSFHCALLIGGGARLAAVREIAPTILGREVEVPEPAEHAALGAARQAAWALAGTTEPPDWPRPAARRYSGQPQPQLRARFAALRDATAGWS